MMGGRSSSKTNLFLRYLFLVFISVIASLPMLYMISTALKPNGAIYEYPPHFFPSPSKITLENFRFILSESKFYINFLNSMVVSVSAVIISAIVSSALAFVLGVFDFKGKRVLFSFIIVTMIIPGTALIIPQFELAFKLKLINKLLGLIHFYVAWVIPFSTFMIKGFMENIPLDLIDAARIDGLDNFRIYLNVAFPLSIPAIASVSIFNFLSSWEEYPWANTVINDNDLRTLPIAIAGFFGQHQFTQWGYVFAMSVLSLIPVVVLFICFQRFFIAGLTSGSVKGCFPIRPDVFVIAPLDARCSLMHDKEKFLFFTEKPKDWGRGCAAIVNLTTPAYLATLKRSRFSDAGCSDTIRYPHVRSGTLRHALERSASIKIQQSSSAPTAQ